MAYTSGCYGVLLKSPDALLIFSQMRVNQLVFNPLQPPILLCASEDHNLYTFDMRNLSSTTQVYKGHVGATMSADWSPTGREFVSGSYDRTVRLWKAGEGAARDTYHTKRMQRFVFLSLLSSSSPAPFFPSCAFSASLLLISVLSFSSANSSLFATFPWRLTDSFVSFAVSSRPYTPSTLASSSPVRTTPTSVFGRLARARSSVSSTRGSKSGRSTGTASGRSGALSPMLPRSSGAFFPLPLPFVTPSRRVGRIPSGESVLTSSFSSLSTRYLPKPIHQATKLKREMLDARRTKEQNRIAHAPKGVDQELLKPAPQKKQAIQKVEQ